MKTNLILFLAGASIFLTGCKSCSTTRPANDSSDPTYNLSILKINADESTEVISIKKDTCIVIPEGVNFQIIGVGVDEQGVKMNNLSIAAKCQNGTYKIKQISNGSAGNVGQSVPTSNLLNLPFNQSVIDEFKSECNSNFISCYRIKGLVTNFTPKSVYSPILILVPSKTYCGSCK
jgi:hypothetical protein